jgi:nucleotide-binding universal stress UspA family protein
MIKDVLVGLSAAAKRDAAIEFGVSLAETFEAHAAGIAFALEPVIPATVMGTLPADIIDAQRAEHEKIANAARSRFDRAAGLAGLSFESHVFGTSLAGAADRFGRMGRRFDISVIMQPDPDEDSGNELIVEAAIFQSGRPVVVVPYVHKGGMTLERVMVCWDGGRAAARAIGDAIPFLERAKSLEVVMVCDPGRQPDSLPGADMGQHLARHGVNVEVKTLFSETNVQETLLSFAADISADFIVMGGYGHSRLREFILGGVTRGMLSSMTVPCLMSH